MAGERCTFTSGPSVYERVGISQVEVYKRLEKSVILVSRKRAASVVLPAVFKLTNISLPPLHSFAEFVIVSDSACLRARAHCKVVNFGL